MENEERDMNMVLIKFNDGPLAGQEREMQSADTMAAEYPGYSPQEQVLDPERGQCLTVQWTGEAANEAAYGDSEQERERYGNQTGLRGREAVDRARGHHQMTSQTGAEQRSTESASAKATGAEGRQSANDKNEAKQQVKDRRDAK